MTAQQVFHRTNVTVPVAPPELFAPDTVGASVPAGGIGWECVVDSTGYASGSSATFTVQFERSGVWKDDIQAIGFTLGQYTSGKGVVTSINSFGSPSIGTQGDAYPDHARLRVDSVPAGTLAAITINLI